MFHVKQCGFGIESLRAKETGPELGRPRCLKVLVGWLDHDVAVAAFAFWLRDQTGTRN